MEPKNLLEKMSNEDKDKVVLIAMDLYKREVLEGEACVCDVAQAMMAPIMKANGITAWQDFEKLFQ